MNRNERAPRTLSDCMWQTGYSAAHFHKPSRWSWPLAVSIGAALAYVLIRWIDWSLT